MISLPRLSRTTIVICRIYKGGFLKISSGRKRRPSKALLARPAKKTSNTYSKPCSTCASSATRLRWWSKNPTSSIQPFKSSLQHRHLLQPCVHSNMPPSYWLSKTSSSTAASALPLIQTISLQRQFHNTVASFFARHEKCSTW